MTAPARSGIEKPTIVLQQITPVQDRETLIARLVEELEDKARDLVHDAASWREAADMTGGATASRLMRDALANEEMATWLQAKADALASLRGATPTQKTKDPSGIPIGDY